MPRNPVKPYRWLAQYYDQLFSDFRVHMGRARESVLQQEMAATAKRLCRAIDVNNARAFERYWKGDVWFERPGTVMVMRNGHSDDGQRAWSDIEWFIQRGKHWQRCRERVEEVCWHREEVRRTFRAAGFTRVRGYDEAPFYKDQPLIGPGCRTFYLAQKAG